MEPLHELVVSHLDHYRGTSYSMHDQSRTWATRHELGTFLDLDHYRGTSYSMHDQSRTWATSLDNKRKPPEVLPKPAVWERRVVNLPITTVSRARARIAPGAPCVCVPMIPHAVDTGGISVLVSDESFLTVCDFSWWAAVVVLWRFAISPLCFQPRSCDRFHVDGGDRVLS